MAFRLWEWQLEVEARTFWSMFLVSSDKSSRKMRQDAILCGAQDTHDATDYYNRRTYPKRHDSSSLDYA